MDGSSKRYGEGSLGVQFQEDRGADLFSSKERARHAFTDTCNPVQMVSIPMKEPIVPSFWGYNSYMKVSGRLGLMGSQSMVYPIVPPSTAAENGAKRTGRRI